MGKIATMHVVGSKWTRIKEGHEKMSEMGAVEDVVGDWEQIKIVYQIE